MHISIVHLCLFVKIIYIRAVGTLGNIWPFRSKQALSCNVERNHSQYLIEVLWIIMMA